MTGLESLVQTWERSRAGGKKASSQWQNSQGGKWRWHDGVLEATGTGTEWASYGWKQRNAPTQGGSTNWVIEVDVAGEANAAGFSFGDFKDFLADLTKRDRRHLQLEIDSETGSWAFRVDGQLQPRCWWDAAVTDARSLVGTDFSFKARSLKQVRFEKLAVHSFSSSCRLSIVITCYRFLQRLRVTLRNWCHQTLTSGAFEIIVVNPHSPDGTHEHLAAVARSFPHLRISELALPPKIGKNKAAMINRAVQQTRGEWIWLTDADCLFGPDAAAAALAAIQDQSGRLFFGQRRYLTDSQTDALLGGRLDGIRDFYDLANASHLQPPENSPWGYTQIVRRSELERILYRENIHHFAHSDNLFIQDCRRHGVLPEQIEGLFCLHLHHPFAWYGTDSFL